MKLHHLPPFGVFVLAAVMALAQPATAQEAGSFQRLGVGVGALGLTVEPTLRLSPSLGMRVPLGFAKLSRTEDVEGNPVTGDLRLGGVALVGDFFPGGAGLRVSGGVLASNLRLSGNSEGSITLNDADYTGRLSAYAETRNKLNPMLMVGYESGSGGAGWSISGDLGVVFNDGMQGSIDVDLDPGVLVDQTAFEADLAAARTQLRDDLADVKLLPYVKVSVAFRF